MTEVRKSVAEALGFDLAEAVTAHSAAVEAHHESVGVPAPIAHPLVIEIVRDGGAFTIVDDPLEPLDIAALRQAKTNELFEAERAQILKIASEGRLRLAMIDLVELSKKAGPAPDGSRDAPGVVYRTDEEQAQFEELQALAARVARVRRHTAVLQIDLEDTPDDQVEAWAPYGWPEA